MTFENFLAYLPRLRGRFRPYIGQDGIVRIFMRDWQMNPITAVAIELGKRGDFSREEISVPLVAASCLGLDEGDCAEIMSVAQDLSHPLRSRMLGALGLTMAATTSA